MRWHCPPDTEFDTPALAVRGRAFYVSVTLTEAPSPHNIESLRVSWEETFQFLKT